MGISSEKQGMSETQETGGLGEMLAGERTKVADIKMVQRAIREGWEMPPRARKEAGKLLMEIAEQRTATVQNSDGDAVEVSNARNQVAAIKALAELDKINQIDYWNQDKNDRIDAGKATERYEGMEIIIPGLPPIKP